MAGGQPHARTYEERAHASRRGPRPHEWHPVEGGASRGGDPTFPLNTETLLGSRPQALGRVDEGEGQTSEMTVGGSDVLSLCRGSGVGVRRCHQDEPRRRAWASSATPPAAGEAMAAPGRPEGAAPAGEGTRLDAKPQCPAWSVSDKHGQLLVSC